MKEISATEAARGFAALLDAVEHEGETFVVRRNGRLVAAVQPVPGATGRAVKDLLAGGPRDTRWAEDLRDLRSGLPVGASPWEG
jgi:antitoxin (DNA-binding transcriptional repressor) of toxin-antitoxin stability system